MKHLFPPQPSGAFNMHLLTNKLTMVIHTQAQTENMKPPKKRILTFTNTHTHTHTHTYTHKRPHTHTHTQPGWTLPHYTNDHARFLLFITRRVVSIETNQSPHPSKPANCQRTCVCVCVCVQLTVCVAG